jgi:2-polyprenyl-6-hydroxyphenyl methylase / 3-demethylubiquinone-9 3-methyltransferase
MVLCLHCGLADPDCSVQEREAARSSRISSGSDTIPPVQFPLAAWPPKRCAGSGTRYPVLCNGPFLQRAKVGWAIAGRILVESRASVFMEADAKSSVFSVRMRGRERMPVDNKLYDRIADTWWNERGFLHVLKALNPARFGYMRNVLLNELHADPKGKRVLDVGCGGGILAEEFAQLGCEVTGIDPSEASLEAARAHAKDMGYTIDYRAGSGEALPFDAATFDWVYCCDVLEHVDDLDRVTAEIARVLKPGGVFLYDTINRTIQSKLIMIKLFQEWSWFSFMPPNVHDWSKFIKPEELLACLARHGLVSRGYTGLSSSTNPLKIIQALRARKRGRLSYLEVGRRIHVEQSKDTSVLYIGYAIKLQSGAD